MKRKRGEIRIDLEYDSWEWRWFPLFYKIPGYPISFYIHWGGLKIKFKICC